MLQVPSLTHFLKSMPIFGCFEGEICKWLLSEIIKNRSSSSSDLNHAVEMILSRFAHINSHTLSKYQHLLEALCANPYTDSKLILRFEKTLRTTNPDYAHEIEKALSIGLASRG